MRFRIAAVSFLNTIPLIEDLRDRPANEILLHCDLPSRLPALVASGRFDAGLIPVVEVLRGQAAGVVPGPGIACRGAVDSVKLFHRGPLRDLRWIGLDRGSRSSVALLKCLLQEEFGGLPDLEVVTPRPGRRLQEGEGILVIGDRCFEMDRALRAEGDSWADFWDLGAAWKALTGLPFVFAVWAVSARFMSEASREEKAALVRLLNQARDAGLERLSELAEREAGLGRLGFNGEATPAAVDYYFRESIHYNVGPEELAGVARFHELCIQYGEVPPGPAPVFL